jgi:hypothetical protein
MTTQPSALEKAAILSQIVKSPDFKDSKKHQDLLKFLVERPSSADVLKETEIALAVFGKDTKFDPTTDSLVRSYISTLRKKLDHYYLTTDDLCSFKLEIPKGHYTIQFTSPAAKPSQNTYNLSFPRLRNVSWVILLLLVLVLSYREFFRGSSTGTDARSVAANPLWNDFIAPNGRPTLIVFGDFFFMRERAKPNGYYRSIMINTIEDYLDYINQNPEFGKRYMKANFTYLRPSAPWGLMQILPILQHGTTTISMNLASQVSPDDFKTNNIIFIGSFKTLYLLKNFLSSLKLEFDLTNASFRIRDKDSDSVHVFRPEMLTIGTLVKDYGVIAKGEGPEGSKLLVLSGFSETGVIQAAQAASDPNLFKAIAERYPPGAHIDPATLTLVFSAEGITQSLYSTNIKYVAGLGAPRMDSSSAHADSQKTKAPGN